MSFEKKQKQRENAKIFEKEMHYHCDRLYKKINNNIQEYGRWENCECIIIVGAVPAIRLLSAKEAAATKAHIRTLEKYKTLHGALAGSVKYLNIPK